MKHDLVGGLRCVSRVALAPVVADGVGEDIPVAVKVGAGDGSSDRGIAL